MSPREHYLRAEELLRRAEQADHDGFPEEVHVAAHLAEVHALLAQIGTPLSWQAAGARPLDGSGRPLGSHLARPGGEPL